MSLIQTADIAFLFLPKLRSQTDFSSAAELHEACLENLTQFSEEARKNSIDEEKIKLSEYAFAALLDELIVVQSPFGLEWLEFSLAIKLFEDPFAGEGFFERLEQLQESARDSDVLEIYTLCLMLGFRGKYQIALPEDIQKLIDGCIDSLPIEKTVTLEHKSIDTAVGHVPKEKSGRSFFVIGLSLLVLSTLLYVGLVYMAQSAV